MKQNYKMKIKIHVQEHFSHVYVKIQYTVQPD